MTDVGHTNHNHKYHHLHVRLAHDDYEHLVEEAEEACEPIATIVRRLVRMARLHKRKTESQAEAKLNSVSAA